MLYFGESNFTNCFIINEIFNRKRKYKLNIFCGDILFEDLGEKEEGGEIRGEIKYFESLQDQEIRRFVRGFFLRQTFAGCEPEKKGRHEKIGTTIKFFWRVI
jgi:hypothetical protein